jgi:hypothetical protein
MSTPQVHTFGIAKYVYASAYDQIEAERDKLREQRHDLIGVNIAIHADNVKLRKTLREVTDVIPKTITREIWNGGAMSEADIEQVVRDEIAKAREAREGEGG